MFAFCKQIMLQWHYDIEKQEHNMILITGATGLNGTALLNEFERHNEAVRLLARTAEDAATIKADSRAQVVIGDMLKPETLKEALRDVDKAVLISSADPFAMAETQISFIDAAKEAGVKHIVKLSCLNPDKNSPARFLRMHAEIEEHLERSGMAWTHIRPAHFMQMYLLNAPTIIAQDSFFVPMAEAHVAPTDVHDIAKVFHAVLTSEGHGGKVYEMSGPESITMHDIAAQFSKALGRSINYINVAPEQFRDQAVSAGLPEQLADAINELYAERRKGSEATVLNETHKLFGMRPTTFTEFIDQNIDAFGGVHM